MDHSDKEALVRTLEMAGLKDPNLGAIKKIEFGKATKTENKRIHAKTNRLLLDVLTSGDLGECIHVTGEMRALTDPFHRRICDEMRRRGKGSFHVLYNIPQEHRTNSAKAVSWNLSQWAIGEDRLWEEELRTIDVIAKRSVDLRAYDTLNEIQYSVFGNKYVLLQEKHKDKRNEKRVWLLDSETINGHLVERGKRLIAKSDEIEQRLFREFAVNVGGVAARRYLFLLRQAREKKSVMHKADLIADRFVCDYSPDPNGAYDALKVMAFVAEDIAEQVSITQAGSDFLEAY